MVALSWRSWTPRHLDTPTLDIVQFYSKDVCLGEIIVASSGFSFLAQMST